MSGDRYITLAQRSEGVFRERASKFIGIAFPIAHEEEFKAALGTIAREHHSARHHCYAWVLGPGGERYRSSDAGEPTGTAGRPILRQLRSRSITQAAIVVVRYFGGTLLGKPGLVHAYGEAAHLALECNRTVEHLLVERYLVRCVHAQVGTLRSILLGAGGVVIDAIYEEHCTWTVEVPKATLPNLLAHCERNGITIESQVLK